MPAQTTGQPTDYGLGSFHAAHGVASFIIVGLAIIYGLHLLGFRFVVAAGVGA